jgi:hypothetical protein
VNKQEALKILSALVSVLGGGILVMLAAGLSVGPLLFDPPDEPLHGVSIVLVLALGLLTMSIGMILGGVLWIFIWKPFLPRSEIEEYLTRPYAPLISDILQKTFDAVHRK